MVGSPVRGTALTSRRQLAPQGIEVELSSHSTDIIQQTQSGQWAIVHILTGVTGQTFSDVKGIMTDVSIFNPQKYSDPKINSLLASAAAATDAGARTKAFAELATYCQQQAWLLTPVLLKTGYAYNAKVLKVNAPPTVVAPDLWYMSPA